MFSSSVFHFSVIPFLHIVANSMESRYKQTDLSSNPTSYRCFWDYLSLKKSLNFLFPTPFSKSFTLTSVKGSDHWAEQNCCSWIGDTGGKIWFTCWSILRLDSRKWVTFHLSVSWITLLFTNLSSRHIMLFFLPLYSPMEKRFQVHFSNVKIIESKPSTKYYKSCVLTNLLLE